MRVIAIDLELNQPSSKIVQIGAVCFQPESGEVYATFNQLVNPGEPIAPEIVALTGIKDKDVCSQPTIVKAASELGRFKLKLKASPIGIVWGAGRSNDVRKIYDEALIENPFKDRILDVKGVFQMYANASGSKMRSKIGLGNACENLGLGWDLKYGEQHNALADAFNTMRVYMFFSKCLKGAVDIKLG